MNIDSEYVQSILLHKNFEKSNLLAQLLLIVKISFFNIQNAFKTCMYMKILQISSILFTQLMEKNSNVQNMRLTLTFIPQTLKSFCAKSINFVN